MISPGFSFKLLKGNKYLVSVCMFLINLFPFHFHLFEGVPHSEKNDKNIMLKSLGFLPERSGFGLYFVKNKSGFGLFFFKIRSV